MKRLKRPIKTSLKLVNFSLFQKRHKPTRVKAINIGIVAEKKGKKIDHKFDNALKNKA